MNALLTLHEALEDHTSGEGVGLKRSGQRLVGHEHSSRLCAGYQHLSPRLALCVKRTATYPGEGAGGDAHESEEEGAELHCGVLKEEAESVMSSAYSLAHLYVLPIAKVRADGTARAGC